MRALRSFISVRVAASPTLIERHAAVCEDVTCRFLRSNRSSGVLDFRGRILSDAAFDVGLLAAPPTMVVASLGDGICFAGGVGDFDASKGQSEVF